MIYKNMLLMAGCVLFAAAVQAQVTIDVDVQQRGPKVSPMLYGIFYEDINHAADGGIYAELIRNRSFEDGPRYGAPADMQGWTTYAAAPSQITARLIQPTKKTPLLNSVQHNALALDIKASRSMPVCLVNEGYWGINAVQGRSYRLSFWAKTLKYQGTMKAMLCSKDGLQIYAETVVRTAITACVLTLPTCCGSCTRSSCASLGDVSWRGRRVLTMPSAGSVPSAR